MLYHKDKAFDYRKPFYLFYLLFIFFPKSKPNLICQRVGIYYRRRVQMRHTFI